MSGPPEGSSTDGVPASAPSVVSASTAASSPWSIHAVIVSVPATELVSVTVHMADPTATVHSSSGELGVLPSVSPGPVISKSTSIAPDVASAGELSVAVSVCVLPIGLSDISGVTCNVRVPWFATATPARDH